MKYARWWLLIIVVVAFCLRFYNIAQNPPAVYGDEISFAWNAWSILKTGTDEYGIHFPLQFRAFDDYKAPIPVYLLVPFFSVLGMDAFSVRLPVVLAGAATVWMTYLLSKQVFLTFAKQKMSAAQLEFLALAAAALLAISPWHIHLSRGYFEATLALFIFVVAVYWFLKGLTQKNYLILSGLAFAATLYTYFTPRIVVPIFLFFLLIYTRKRWWPIRRTMIIALAFLVVVLLPLGKLALFDKGANRMEYFVRTRLDKAAEEATLEQSIGGGPEWGKRLLHNRYVVAGRNVTIDYLEHFSVDFWYLYGDNSLRYFLGKMGMFHLVELPFLLAGMYMLAKKNVKVLGFILGWLLITPIPSALVGRSFAVRSLAMLPAPFLIISYGLWEVLQWIKNNRPRWKMAFIFIVILFFGLSSSVHLWRYFFDYPTYAATWWGWENKAALEYAQQREDKYDQIILSDFYTGMPLALGFYLELDPLAWRQARDNKIILEADKEFMHIGKYYIGSFDLDQKRLAKEVIPPHTLYIGRPAETGGRGEISAPDDGRVLFTIHERAE